MEHSNVRYTFRVNDENLREILIAELSAIRFDGFEERSEELLAFISSNNLDENAVDAIASKYDVGFDKQIISSQNWNAIWEASFQPVVIGDAVAIRASFHQPIKTVAHEIIITPKMSFGTGHHATTYMMIERMCQLDFNNKSVFDFGTGTGVLAILAEKLGAESVTAIDNDEQSIENAAENIFQNDCTKISLALRIELPRKRKYNFVLANINRNIIIENFPLLVEVMQPGGNLLLSGLLEKDKSDVMQLAFGADLAPVTGKDRDGWILLQFVKK